MNAHRFLLQAATFAAISCACSFANATPIDGSATGLTNPGVTITFDEHVLANNVNVTNQYADKGVTFDPGLYYSPEDDDESYYAGVIDGQFLGNYFDGSDGPRVSTITLNFATPQTRAAFGLAANDGPFLFQAFSNQVLVDEFRSAPVNHAFYGFEDVSFDSIAITSLPEDFNYFDLDHIQFDASPLATTGAIDPSRVPEPEGLALLGLGLLGAVSMRGRSRKAA